MSVKIACRKASNKLNTKERVTHLNELYALLLLDDSATADEVKKFFQVLGGGSLNELPDENYGGDDQEFENKQDVSFLFYRKSVLNFALLIQNCRENAYLLSSCIPSIIEKHVFVLFNGT